MRNLFNRFLEFIKGKETFGFHPTDTELEVENERSFGRRSIERQVRHLWDAHKKPPRLDGLLRKLTPRTRSDEEIQRAREAKRIRNSGIKRFSDRPEYSLIVDFFKREEVNAYFLLRHPEEKPANVSMDLFVGEQTGILYIVEKFRLMVTTAFAEIEMETAREQMKEDNLNRQKKAQKDEDE